MTGQLYINGKDAWQTWGAFLVDDSLDNLLLPASPKPYTKNNFRSQNGTQVFIVNTKKDEREIHVEFCISANTCEEFLIAYKKFVDELCDGLVIVKIPFIDEEFRFVLSKFLSLGYYGKFGKLSVLLSESNNVWVTYNALATEENHLILTEDYTTILI